MGSDSIGSGVASIRCRPRSTDIMYNGLPNSTYTIEVPTRLSVAVFESILRRVHGLYQRHEHTTGGLLFDLSRCRFLTLGGMLSLLALAGAIAEGRFSSTKDGSRVYVRPPTGDVLAYLHTMQFFEMSNLQCWFCNAEELARADRDMKNMRKYKRRQVSEELLSSDAKASWQSSYYLPIHFIPACDGTKSDLSHFESGCTVFLNSALESLQPILVDVLGFSRDLALGFWRANKEVYENIFRHSQSWGLTAVQVYPTELHMCHVDIGLGITETLGKRYSSEYANADIPWTDKTAISKAFEEGSSRDTHSPGIGLAIVQKFVQNSGGNLALRSGRAQYLVSKGQKKGFADVVYFPGTQVYISIPRS